MSLTLKDAVRKMHNDPHARYYFFFCEKGENGKPVLLADTHKIDPRKHKEAQEVLETAKAKGSSQGAMQMAGGVLTLKPRGAGLSKSKLQTGAMIAAGNAKVFDMVTSVVVGEAEPETEDTPPQAPPHVETPAEHLEKTIAQMRDMLEAETDRKKADAISVLLEKKENELAKLTGAPLPQREDRTVDAGQKRLMEHGIVPKAPGAEYEGEDQKLGWRVAKHKPEPPERGAGEAPDEFARRQKEYEEKLAKWEKVRDSEVQVTKYYTDQERQQAQVHVDEQGRLRDASGRLLKGTGAGYVLDTEGQMHQFKEGDVHTSDKDVPDLKKPGATIKQVQSEHHTSPLAGAQVSGAGGLKTNIEGLIKKITNKSGHYKPGAVQMIQTVEGLLKKGALLDKQWTDARGQPLSGQALQVYNAVMAAQEHIIEQLADDPNANVTAQLDTVDKAKKMLTKLGCGPSNRMSEAVVEFLELKQHMTGEEISTGKGEKTSVAEFLRSGALYLKAPKELRDRMVELQKKLDEADEDDVDDIKDDIEDLKKEMLPYRQDNIKADVLEELRKKTADTRRELKEDSTFKGVGTKGPLPGEMQDMARGLSPRASLPFFAEVEAFEKRFGSIQDLYDNQDRFEDILVAQSGLVPLILKKFPELKPEDLEEWMDEDPKFNFFELIDKCDDFTFETLFQGYFEET